MRATSKGIIAGVIGGLALALAPGGALGCHAVKAVLSLQKAGASGGFSEYTADGTVRGGLGQPESPVGEAKRTVPPEDNQAVWSTIASLGTGCIGKDDPVPAGDHYALLLVFDTGQKVRFSWPVDGEPRDPAIRQLSKLVLKNRVGGW